MGSSSVKSLGSLDADLNPVSSSEIVKRENSGTDISRARKEDAGKVLSDTLLTILRDIEIPDGLSALGYKTEDIPTLVKGAMPQHRLIKLSPRPVYEDDMAELFEKSMKIY